MSPNSLFAILMSYIFTLYLIPKWINRAKRAGLVGKDLHKHDSSKIPEVGGLPVVCGFLAGILTYIAFRVFVYKEVDFLHMIFAVVVSVLIAAVIGLVDDILGWKIGLRQSQKAILTIAIAIPIMVINAGVSTMNIPFMGQINFGIFYPLLLVPIAIVATSNAFNMMAGYNGLEASMGIIILTTLSFISYFEGAFWVSMLGLCMVAALAAFLFYNWYPAKLFPGDSLTYATGSLVGIMVILANIEKVGIILFSLYIIQFFLKARGLMKKESFAKLENNSLKEPYDKIYGLEHVVIKILNKIKRRATELEVVLSLLGLQVVIAVLTIVYYFCC